MQPPTTTQDALTLAGRALIALLFIPAGWAKIGGFAGLSGYLAVVGGLLVVAAFGAGGWSLDGRRGDGYAPGARKAA